MQCYNCGKMIELYYEKNGHNYCDQCIKDFWPKCSICGRPMNQWTESEDGKKYCSEECRENDLPHCCICGKPVKQWFTDNDGRIFCSDICFEKTLPRCDACGKRMKKWSYTQSGIKYCDDTCRKNIEKIMEWFDTNDGVKNIFKSYNLKKESEYKQKSELSLLTFMFLATGISENETIKVIEKIKIKNNIQIDISSCIKRAFEMNFNDVINEINDVAKSEEKYHYAELIFMAIFFSGGKNIAAVADILKILNISNYEARFFCNQFTSFFKNTVPQK